MASETGCHHHSSPELAPPVTGHVLPVFQTDQTSSAFMAEHSGWPPRPCLRVGELQLATLFRSPFFLLSCCFLPVVLQTLEIRTNERLATQLVALAYTYVLSHRLPAVYLLVNRNG
ncbi:hypothetical protein CAOG_010102 [Capsaspora owczarzaki ATCC 30864]|uniref:Uncharacterized protein n=1 Tax=Capsaspora owczarzaki (strain ATCC 30864) TaxID=595528 RepID=A0A0D2X576_CAPO3|nr:hypothetical protein CAOG_010102 [Capsaspora owczarzaki ATCC 30864]